MEMFANRYQTEHLMLGRFLPVIDTGVLGGTFWSYFISIIEITLKRLLKDEPLTLLFSLVLL